MPQVHTPLQDYLQGSGYRNWTSVEQFGIWYDNLTQEVKAHIADILNQDYNTDTSYITHRASGATLMGGWDFVRSSGFELHTRRGTTNYFIGRMTTFVPFEWWLDYDAVNRPSMEDGFEPVFGDSINIKSVLWFLFMERLHKESAVTMYVGRYTWDHISPLPDSWSTRQGSPISYSADIGLLSREEMEASLRSGTTFKRPKNPMPKRERQMLYLLTKVVEKWNDLCKNEGAYTWLWLNTNLRNLVRYRKLYDRRFAGKTNKEIYEQAQVVFEKFTQKEWVSIGLDSQASTQQLWPKKMCSCYSIFKDSTFSTIGVRWVKKSTFESLKGTGEIYWDAESKQWTHDTLKTQVKAYKPNSKNPLEWTTKTVTANPTLFATHTKCPCCNYYTLNTNMQVDYDLGDNGCVFCFPTVTKRDNPKVSKGYCFSAYHSHRNGAWKFYYARTPKEDPRSFCVGMEVEMQTKNPAQQNDSGSATASWNILQKQWEIDETLNQIYFERDGSLQNGGLEMITNPMSLPYHQWYWSLMLPIIRNHCVGWNTEKLCGEGIHNINYGIHMTFSRNWWTDLQLARLVKFIDNTRNKKFIQALAQRQRIYSGEFLANAKKDLKDKVVIKDMKIAGSTSRYVPVNIKADNKLVELRFFRTTLNTESFLKNLEWLFSFHEWVRSTPFNIESETYIQWLLNNKTAIGRYSNLYRYFSRDILPCKGGNVKNPWLKQFKDIRNSKPLIFPIEPELIVTPESVLGGDIECV